MQHTVTADEIELRVTERKCHDVGLLEADVRRRGLASGLEVVGAGVDPDDFRDVRSKRECESTRTAAGVQRGLVPRERTEQPAYSSCQVFASTLLQGEPQLDAHVRSSAETSPRASASASSRVEIVPAARSSSMTSRIRPIAGPGSSPSSSPRTSGADGSARRAASTTPASSGAPTYASASSAHGSVSLRNR